MAVGFFAPKDTPGLPAGVFESRASVLRLDTRRTLQHRLFDTESEAAAWSGFVLDDAGYEFIRCGWVQSDLDALDLSIPGPDWVRGFRHELVLHLAAGGALPYETPLTGYGTATLVSTQGYLLTAQHLVSGPQRHYALPERVFDPVGVPAHTLRVLTAEGADLGGVRLCYVDSDLDLAVLALNPQSDIPPIALADDAPSLHERVWQWGYPHRSLHTDEERAFFELDQADHGLRYSVGLVVAAASKGEWFTDGDAVLGSSGSALVNDAGQLVGVYRGGGAGERLPTDPYRYRRCVDVHQLKSDLPDVFGAPDPSSG